MRDIPPNTTIYLMLGRIDDVDVVYLNGKEIGSGGKFPPDYETAYDRIRKYTIPADYLKEDDENVIAVRVYDGQGLGGIYEGPIGIMSAENYRRYRNKYHTDRSFWDYMYDKFFRNDNYMEE